MSWSRIVEAPRLGSPAESRPPSEALIRALCRDEMRTLLMPLESRLSDLERAFSANAAALRHVEARMTTATPTVADADATERQLKAHTDAIQTLDWALQKHDLVLGKLARTAPRTASLADPVVAQRTTSAISVNFPPIHGSFQQAMREARQQSAAAPLAGAIAGEAAAVEQRLGDLEHAIEQERQVTIGALLDLEERLSVGRGATNSDTMATEAQLYSCTRAVYCMVKLLLTQPSSAAAFAEMGACSGDGRLGLVELKAGFDQ